MSEVADNQIKPIAAHHFRGPISDSENGYRTVPILLRAVADWMDQHDLQDAEFYGLVMHKSFIGDGDEHKETATVYYIPAPGAEKR